MQTFDVLGWLAGFGLLVVVDLTWFHFDFVWKGIYNFEHLLSSGGDVGRRLVGASAVLLCAAAASAVLTVFRGTSREDAAAAGAIIGGLVFFVFNACMYYVLNNLSPSLVRSADADGVRWSAKTALADFVYGTGLYTAAAVVIWEVSS